MKRVQILLATALLSLGLSSCGKICVRCENGVLGDTVTECFLDNDERDSFVTSRELLGYTCTDD